MKKTDDRESLPAQAQRFLVFRIGRRIYALAAESVAEVIRAPAAARVPQAPPALLGVSNFRGAILPLVSLRTLLGLEQVEENGASRAIVLDGALPIALAVDAVDALVSVELARIDSQPGKISAEPGERVTGMFSLSGDAGAAKVLDIHALLSEAFASRERAQKNAVGQSGVAASEHVGAAARSETLITFDVANQEFAFNLEAIHEVLSLPEAVAAIPRADASVVGMMAYRERLLPLLSLRALLGFASGAATNERERVLVLAVGGGTVGLVADSARAVISADPALIDPPPAVIAARTNGQMRIKSVYRGEGGNRLISILAPERLFGEDVMERLNVGQDQTGPRAEDEDSQDERKFLIFRLGQDEFGLPVEAVDEVARAPDQITRVPKTPKFLEGVVNLRGEVLPVVDQRRRFDMAKSERAGRRLIVVRSERHRAGLIVDSVSEVLGARANAIGPPPDLTGDITRLIAGVVNLDKRIILLLDPSELLTRAERGLLDSLGEKTRGRS